jgi:hypothetical protein
MSAMEFDERQVWHWTFVGGWVLTLIIGVTIGLLR